MKMRSKILLILALSLSLGAVRGDQVLLELAFGDRADQIPGTGEPARLFDGLVAAVQAHPAGGWLLLVPERRALLRFDAEGGFVGTIVPRREGLPLPSKTCLVDFDVDPAGTLFLLDRAAGCVWRCDGAGQVQEQFGNFLHAARLDWSDGKVAVVDLGAGTVSAFDESGALRWQRKGWRWTSVLTRNQEFVGKMIRNDRLFLLRARATALPPAQRGLDDEEGTTPSRASLLATHRVVEEGWLVNEAHVLGRDDAGRIAVMSEEGPQGHSKIFRLLRFDGAGRLEAQRAMPKWDDWLPERPRFMRLTRGGELLGTTWTDTSWKLVRYDFTTSEEGEDE